MVRGIRGFIPAAGTPAMRSLTFGQVNLVSGGHSLDDFALLVVEFGPGFQSSFFASWAGIKFFHNALRYLLPNFTRVT